MKISVESWIVGDVDPLPRQPELADFIEKIQRITTPVADFSLRSTRRWLLILTANGDLWTAALNLPDGKNYTIYSEAGDGSAVPFIAGGQHGELSNRYICSIDDVIEIATEFFANGRIDVTDSRWKLC